MRYKTSFFHRLYKFTGRVFCRVFLLWCWFRDKIDPPKEDSILIVAHPDDDTLFFHTFIKKYRPYVCLMTIGWSFRRFPCFIRAMRQYKVRYRMYPLESRDTRMDLLMKNVASCLKLADFKICATHGATGEYGHEMHKRVHEAVVSQAKCTVLTPVSAETISSHPLSQEEVSEKEAIFKNIYTTELFVLEQYREWVTHECLVAIPRSGENLEES